MNVVQVQVLGKGQVVVADLLETALIKIHQVHFVDCDYHVLDAQQRRDKAVTLGLGLNAVARIDQDNRQLAG